jgi:hypothetical protein
MRSCGGTNNKSEDRGEGAGIGGAIIATNSLGAGLITIIVAIMDRLLHARQMSRISLLFVMSLMVLQAPRVWAQVLRQPVDSSQPGVEPQLSTDPATRKIQREMQKQRNLQREEEIKRDTDKLLELATQLKQYVDKTNENIISLDVIRKADEIEKLAKSVKEKMKAP